MARYIDADKLKERLVDFSRWCMDGRKEGVDFVLDCPLPAMLEEDVVPKSEEGAECPTCYGTGRIGTTNWLTKNMTKKQIAEEKAQAIAEHEQHIKAEVAREIFEELEKWLSGDDSLKIITANKFSEIKKKYTEGE